MRISNRMLQLNTMVGLRDNLARLNEAQRHAASGKRIEHVSDDPVDAAQAMRMQGQLASIDQFKRNGTSATTRLASEDIVLTAARDLLTRARKLAMSVNATNPADPTRTAALQELGFIKEQMVSLANTRIGGERLFGGGETAPPFKPDGTYIGGATVHDAQIDESVTVPTSHTGEIFASTFQSLDALDAALRVGTPAGISAAVAPLQAAEESLLARQAEAGARQRQINDTVAQIGSRAQLLLDRIQTLTDVDPAESLLKVQAAQQSLERAYVVANRVLSLSITDFMR